MQVTGAVGSRVAGVCSRVGKVGGWCSGLVRRAGVAGRFGGQVWRVDVAVARSCRRAWPEHAPAAMNLEYTF